MGMPAMRVMRPSVAPVDIVAHHRNVAPQGVDGFVHGSRDFRKQRRRRHGDELDDRAIGGVQRDGGDGDLWISNDALERLANVVGIFAGENAAIYVGARRLRKRVWRVAAGEHGRHAGGAQQRVVVRHRGKARDGAGIVGGCFAAARKSAATGPVVSSAVFRK